LGSSDTATRNIFVANIPPETTEQDVQAHFSKYGPVLGVKFLPKKSDTIAAFVDFQNVDDAREAHDSVNMINGIKIRTDYNTRRANNPPPGGPSLDRYDDRDRGPPPRDSYYDRAPPAAARYRDEYEDRGPPPRYRDDPPPRYREEYDRPPPPRYEDRYNDRGPPPRGYDDRDARGPPPRYDDREREYYGERGGPPPSRYDVPPPRYDDRYR